MTLIMLRQSGKPLSETAATVLLLIIYLSFASPDSQRLGHKKTTWFLAYMAENE